MWQSNDPLFWCETHSKASLIPPFPPISIYTADQPHSWGRRDCSGLGLLLSSAWGPATALSTVGRGAWGRATAQPGASSGVKQAALGSVLLSTTAGTGDAEKDVPGRARREEQHPRYTSLRIQAARTVRSGKAPLNPFRSGSAEDSAKKHEAHVCILCSNGTYKVSLLKAVSQTLPSALSGWWGWMRPTQKARPVVTPSVRKASHNYCGACNSEWNHSLNESC